MSILLSTIAIGSVVGVGNHFVALLVLGAFAKAGHYTLDAPFDVLSSWWTLGLIGAYILAQFFFRHAPMIGLPTKVIHNSFIPFVAGTASLASVGIITDMHPMLVPVVDAATIFDADGTLGLGTTGILVATIAAALAIVFAMISPAVSEVLKMHDATGTTTPIWKLVPVFLMLLFLLALSVSPWLVTILFGVLLLTVFWLARNTLREARRRAAFVMAHPRKGFLLLTSFFVWGAAHLATGSRRAGSRWFTLWLVWVALTLFSGGALVIPVFGALAPSVMLALGVMFGIRSVRRAWPLVRAHPTASARPASVPLATPIPSPAPLSEESTSASPTRAGDASNPID